MFEMASISDLPPEILLQIFQFYILTENQASLLSVIYNVCTRWRDICFEPPLWSTYDGTLSFQTMMMLCERGCFRKTKEFTYSRISIVEEKDALNLFSKLQNVDVMHFFKVKIFTGIPSELGKNQGAYGLRFKNRYGCKCVVKKCNNNLLLPCLSLKGADLLSLNLSFCVIEDVPAVLRCIADWCPNLEELRLIYINCETEGFPTEYLQEKCPKLKLLYLDNEVALSMIQYDKGFPNLEEFSYACASHTTDFQVNCVLFNSPRLKNLDLSRSDVSAQFLCSLPAKSVECLCISETLACDSEKLSNVMKKWYHSLKVVDISCASDVVNQAVLDLVLTPVHSVLEELNLNDSDVTFNTVKIVLNKCTKLQRLHLESCSLLTKDMRRFHNGKDAIEKLKSKFPVTSEEKTERKLEENNHDEPQNLLEIQIFHI